MTDPLFMQSMQTIYKLEGDLSDYFIWKWFCSIWLHEFIQRNTIHMLHHHKWPSCLLILVELFHFNYVGVAQLFEDVELILSILDWGITNTTLDSIRFSGRVFILVLISIFLSEILFFWRFNFFYLFLLIRTESSSWDSIEGGAIGIVSRTLIIVLWLILFP